MREKYIFESCYIEGISLHWWVPKEAIKLILLLEEKNPDYEFVQFVTSPGNGGSREFAIMKLN